MAETTSLDAMPTDPDSGAPPLLFCPFCRECFEGETHCPEHDLALVEFTALPRQAHERSVRWDEPVPVWDARFGRLEIAAGVVLSLVGFFALPLCNGRFEDAPVSWTAMRMAEGRAPNLWTVPFVAVLFVVFLYRRRTPLEMRGARLAGIVLAIMPVVSLAYTLFAVHRGVLRAHGAITLSWGAAVWVIAASSVLLLVGSVRFGAFAIGEALPHGAAPDEPGAHIEPESKNGERGG